MPGASTSRPCANVLDRIRGVLRHNDPPAYDTIQQRLAIHFPPLDGIRGVAILLVMAEHLFFFSPQKNWELPIAWLLRTGWIGVDLFFVLSGFLITGVLLNSKGAPHFFKNFYMRRVLRIFPVNYLYLGCFTLGILYLTHFSDGAANEKAREAISELPWVWLYSTNILIAKRGAFITSSINQFWSLAIEEQFYLVWPALVFNLSRERLLKFCGMSIVLSLLFRLIISLTCENHEIINHVLTVARLDQFCCGDLVALLLRSPENIVKSCAKWTAPFLTCSLLMVVLCEWLKRGIGFDIGYVDTVEYTFSGFSFAALICSVMLADASSTIYRIFSFSKIRHLGKYSYALYIIRFSLLIASNWILWHRLGNYSMFLSNDILAVVFRGTIVGVISFMIAWLSWRFFEKPFLNLKKYFVD